MNFLLFIIIIVVQYTQKILKANDTKFLPVTLLLLIISISYYCLYW